MIWVKLAAIILGAVLVAHAIESGDGGDAA